MENSKKGKDAFLLIVFFNFFLTMQWYEVRQMTAFAVAVPFSLECVCVLMLKKMGANNWGK